MSRWMRGALTPDGGGSAVRRAVTWVAVRAYRVHRICGNGLYAHRYRAGIGFANPSVYSPDLQRLIGHIRAHEQTSMPGSPDPAAKQVLHLPGRHPGRTVEAAGPADRKAGRGGGTKRSHAASP